MPLYEYVCRNCGEAFEKLVRLSSQEPVICPTCKSTDCVKSISLFGTSRPAGGASVGGAASCAPSG